MNSKLSLHALAFAGIIAISGLPAFAAEMTPATPVPGAAVQSDMKAGASGAGNTAAVGANAKADAKVVTGNPKDSKTVQKAATDTKTTATKDVTTAKDKAKDQTPSVQTAKLPATPVPAPSTTVNGSASSTVQH